MAPAAAGTVGTAGLLDETMALGTLQETEAFHSQSFIPLKQTVWEKQGEMKALL